MKKSMQSACLVASISVLASIGTSLASECCSSPSSSPSPILFPELFAPSTPTATGPTAPSASSPQSPFPITIPATIPATIPDASAPTSPAAPAAPYSPPTLLGSAQNSAAAHQRIQATTFQHLSATSTVVSTRLLGTTRPSSVAPKKSTSLSDRTGLAGGNGTKDWNAWGSLTWNDAGYDGFGAASTGRYESEIWNGVVGSDYRISPSLIIGASVAFDSGDGQAGLTSLDVSTKGYAVAPYLGWQISETLAFDLSIGMGTGEATVGAEETDSNRSFYGANLNYARWIGDFQLSARAGYLSAVEDGDDTTVNGAAVAGSGAKNKLDQLRLGMQAGYWLADGIMPYVGLTATQDVRRTSLEGEDWDKSAYLVSVGTNIMSLSSGTTFGLVYTHEFGRSDTDNNSVLANLNIRF